MDCGWRNGTFHHTFANQASPAQLSLVFHRRRSLRITESFEGKDHEDKKSTGAEGLGGSHWPDTQKSIEREKKGEGDERCEGANTLLILLLLGER